MTLATHAIIGGSLGHLISRSFTGLGGFNLPVAFLAGSISHFLFDAIPHWDYPLRSAVKDEAEPLNNDLVLGRNFAVDLIKIGFDFALGGLLLYWFYGKDGALDWSLWIGALGGVLPDFLQFAYFKLRRFPLTGLQRFHLWIHAKKRLDHQPVRGIVLQALLVLVIIWLI